MLWTFSFKYVFFLLFQGIIGSHWNTMYVVFLTFPIFLLGSANFFFGFCQNDGFAKSCEKKFAFFYCVCLQVYILRVAVIGVLQMWNFACTCIVIENTEIIVDNVIRFQFLLCLFNRSYSINLIFIIMQCLFLKLSLIVLKVIDAKWKQFILNMHEQSKH